MCDECRAETTRVLASPEKRTLRVGLQKAWNKVHDTHRVMPVGMLRHPREKGNEDEEEPSRKRARTVRDEEAEELAANLDMGEGSLVAIETADRARPPGEKDNLAPFASKIVDLPLIQKWAQEIRDQFPGSPIALRIFWMELFKHFFDFSVRASPIENPDATWEDWARAFEHVYRRRGYPVEIPKPDGILNQSLDLIQALALRYGIRGTVKQEFPRLGSIYLLRTRNVLVTLTGSVGILRYTRATAPDEYRMLTRSDEFLEVNPGFVICWSEPIQRAEELDMLTDFTFYGHEGDTSDTNLTIALPDGTFLEYTDASAFDDIPIRVTTYPADNQHIGMHVEWINPHDGSKMASYNALEGNNERNLPCSLSMNSLPMSTRFTEIEPPKEEDEEEDERELDDYFIDTYNRQLRYENPILNDPIGTAPFRDATQVANTLVAVDSEGKLYMVPLEHANRPWRNQYTIPRPLPWPVISATVIQQSSGTGPSLIPVYMTADRELIVGDLDMNNDEKDEDIHWIQRNDGQFYIPTHFKQQNLTQRWGRRFIFVRTLGNASLFLVDEDGEIQIFGPDGYQVSDQIQNDTRRQRKPLTMKQVLEQYTDLFQRPYLLRFGTIRKGIYMSTIHLYSAARSVLLF